VYFAVVSTQDDSVPTMETEPNDSPAEADPLQPAVSLAGFVAGDAEKGDLDWYRLPGPGTVPWGLSLGVTGVPGLDFAVQLVDPSRADPLAEVNKTGQGGGEQLPPVAVDKPEVYVKVQEVRVPGVPPGHFPQVPYGITYQMYDASYLEKEPNNSLSTATAISVGTALQGVFTLHDRDWYCLPAGQPASSIQLSGVRGLDLVLILHLGPQGEKKVVDEKGTDQGESALVPPGPGPICAEIQAKKLAVEPPACKPLLEPYQILFQ
jgi:hypothetical protein